MARTHETSATSPIGRMIATGFRAALHRARGAAVDGQTGVLREAADHPDVQAEGAALVEEETGRFFNNIKQNAGDLVTRTHDELNPEGKSGYALFRDALTNEGDGVLKKIGKSFVAGALNVGTGLTSFIVAQATNIALDLQTNPIIGKDLHGAIAGGFNKAFSYAAERRAEA